MALLQRFHYRPEFASALGKLMRATAFRLTLVYLLVFIIFAVSLLGYFALNTRRLITEQITNRVNLEVNALREQYETGGIRRLVTILDLRARRPGSSLYLLTTPSGEGLAGNVSSLEPGVLDHPGWFEFELPPNRVVGRKRASRAGARRGNAWRFSPAGRARS